MAKRRFLFCCNMTCTLRQWVRASSLAMACFSLLAVLGCASSKKPSYEEIRGSQLEAETSEPDTPTDQAFSLPVTPVMAVEAAASQQGSSQYRLRSGDTIAVKFLHNAELNVDAVIQPDGRIFLPLVGEMQVEALTVRELHVAISARYKDFVRTTGYGVFLQEGDFLDLRFVYNPELNIGAKIRSDGKISLPLLGDITAADRRPEDLRQQIVRMYADHIKVPDMAMLVGETTARKIFADEAFIVVTLVKAADQAVFVGGEVQTPRAVKFTGRMTVLQAIMEAGGVKDTGDLSQVVVVRRGQFETPTWIRTNLSQPLSGRAVRNDVTLRNGDVIVIPLTGIGKVNLFVRHYIRDVLPIHQATFTITAPIGAATIP